MKFRSTKTIEAIQFTGDNIKELKRFICREIPGLYPAEWDSVDSIENTMMLGKGDWMQSDGYADYCVYSDSEIKDRWVPVDTEEREETIDDIELEIHREVLKQEKAKTRICEAEAEMIETEIKELV